MSPFADRHAAGVALAEALKKHTLEPNPLILALPRGGVPVAFEVAKALGLPMDVLIVRKLGLPGHKEFAMGAIASGGECFVDERTIQQYGIDKATLDEVIMRETAELKRREIVYRGTHEAPMLSDRMVILVDDGVATGATMQAAIRAVKSVAKKIVVAVPVMCESSKKLLSSHVDAIVAVKVPVSLDAVGAWYQNFAQTTDEEVIFSLKQGWR